MSEIPLCNLVIPSSISSDELESLKTSLKMASIKLEKSQERIIGADDLVFIATVMGGISATVQLADYSIKAAKVIIKWRQKQREKSKEIKGRLEKPNRPPLDLNNATDEEIEEWLSR